MPSGLRFRPLDRYPYLAFYMDAGDRIHTWRVLRGAPDIPA
jgi:plasmid stabilization system protein ParE